MADMNDNREIKIENLEIDFRIKKGTVSVIKNIDMSVKKGRVTALVGESGSGKSVTSHAVMGLLPMNVKKLSGKIWIDGESVESLSVKERQKINGTKVGMIFQDPVDSMNPLYTVGNQMIEGIRRHRKISKSEAEEKAVQSLEAVNLSNARQLMKKYPFELSGGMCQRVMIAMTMSLEPEYLIADEPTTALDVTVQKQIIKELLYMSHEKNVGILFITHDLGVVAEVADDVYIMKDGKIVEQGTVYDIFDHPEHPYTKMLLDAIL